MLHYPDINPIAFKIGPLSVHWYGLMYLLGFAFSWLLLSMRAKRSRGEWTVDQISDLIFYGVLGVVLGGRLGYMFFYQPLTWVTEHPLQLFKIWEGGMSFHGGLLGVMAAMFFYKRKYHKGFFQTTDFIAPVVPIGLGFGRIGNFINAELPGDTMSVPHWWNAWGTIYPARTWVNSGYDYVAKQADLDVLRHPSSLYQCLLEGVLLFIVLWVFSKKPRPLMAVSGMFSLLYGCFRFFDEFFRMPDVQEGYKAFGWLTRGQQLCIPMILLGVTLLFLAYRKRRSV